MAFDLERLKVSHRSSELTLMVYDFSKKCHKQEMFGLISRINRADNSISLNIAEGPTGQSNAEPVVGIGDPFSDRGCVLLASYRQNEVYREK